MKLCYVFLLLVFCKVRISLSETIKVSIKSHEVLTKEITLNDVKGMYDNDMSTVGSFYYEKPKYVEVDFDLQANYLIEKIVATIKSDSPDIRFKVGNLIKGEGGLHYDCSKKNNSNNVYECIPKCSVSDSTRNGIVARKLLMSFLVNNKWTSIYELEVYAKQKTTKPNFVSDNKLVLSDNCEDQSWLLTNSQPLNTKFRTHKIGTKIFLEKNYIINEIDVKFDGKRPENLKIQLSNGEKKVDITIDMEKCTLISTHSKFTCQLDRLTFPTRVVTINTDGVLQLFLRGKTVFYPTMSVQASENLKKNLMLTCNINPCDLSVHSDCSENAIKSGVQFFCSNKRLLRMPSGSNLNSFVIINQGQVEQVWSKTKFKVESNTEKAMIISMPRSWQYFGQYQCSCLATDEFISDITSKTTNLIETDFLENLVFKTEMLYKLDEYAENYKSVVDSLLILRQGSLKNSYIAAKLSAYSLVNNLNVFVNVPSSSSESEKYSTDTSVKETIKAFDDNSNSWFVNIYKYQQDELYPEFLHNNGLKINYTLPKLNLIQEVFIRFIKINEDNIEKPEFIKFITDKLISIKVIYGGSKSIKLSVNEKTCKKSDIQEIGKIEKNQCTSNNNQLTCSNHDNVSLMSITKDRNIATNYSYSAIEIAGNKTLEQILVDSILVLNEKDINVHMKYVDINSDPNNPSITKVDVEVTFNSKIINDFIPCGKVSLTISEPQKIVKKMILQVSQIIIPVELISNSVNVSLNLKIEGIAGSYSTVLTVVNPTTFHARNVKIINDTKLALYWNSIDKVTDDLLVGYEVNIETTIISCNSKKSNVLTIKKTDNQNIYQIALDPPSTQHSSKLVVSVQPIFKNGKKGQKQAVEQLLITTKNSKITIDENISTKDKLFKIIPSQSDIPCDIEDVEFTLQSAEVVHVVKEINKINTMEYKINNLIPGRKYNLTAQVKYKFGPADSISEIYSFELADEISISESKHIAPINSKVNITCNADVGPMDKFRKTIEWRRSDSSPLPQGVSSETYPDLPGSAFLIMKKSSADHSGDYGCFVKPAAKFGVAKITITINDLEVTPSEKQVDFSETLAPISIKCFSSTVGDGELQWSDSDNLPISKNENNKFNVIQHISDQSITSTLIIKVPSIETSGTYKCLKSIGTIKAFQKFTLYGKEKLQISVIESSQFVGETTKLRCKGQLASKDQKVVWDVKTIIRNDKKIVNAFYPNQSDHSIQDIEIINHLELHRVICKIVPSYEANKNILSETYSINLKPKIQVEGPTNVTAGSNVSLICFGYPIGSSNVLQWVFYNETSAKGSEKGVILSSKDKHSTKSIEPIKLEWKLKNVKDQEKGRYECKFTTNLKSEYLTSKSISLYVESNNVALASNTNTNTCPDCSKKGAHRIFSSYLSRAIYMSVIVEALLYLL